MRFATILLLSTMLMAATVQTAQAQAGAVVTGAVTDGQGAPLPGANVVLEGTAYGASTDAEGRYVLEDVPPGTYTVAASFVGYVRQTADINVGAGQRVVQDLTLTRAAVEAGELTVTVGSRARRTAASELAVPVDVYGAEQLSSTGSIATTEILQAVAPSVNFPHQTVADGMDALRPFTLRGLSPDHTLVLVNGKRHHKAALVNRLGSGVQKGSSVVDLNAIPANAIQQIEVLRDGASAQYGSDAIAGVVNLQLKDTPVPLAVSGQVGGYATGPYDNDGTTYDLQAAYGVPLGARGFLNAFGEYRFRNPTNRAGPDPRDQLQEGDADTIEDTDGDGVGEVAEKNNPVGQPNFHWGDGESEDVLLWANGAYPLQEGAGAPTLYAFGGYSYRQAFGQGFYRRASEGRNWTQIYPEGFLPNFEIPIADYSASAGVRGTLGAWSYDLNAQTGQNDFEYNITNSLNASLGPNIPPNQTAFYAGTVSLRQSHVQLDVNRGFEVGLASPLSVAAGAIYRADTYQLEAGEEASYIDGGEPASDGGRAAPGAQVFPGFRPDQEVDETRTSAGVYAEAEADLTDFLLVSTAGRFENYNDFGETLNGKVALRLQPAEQVVFRGAVSTGFRAPNLAQRYFSKVSTIFQDDPATGETRPFEVGLFPVQSNVAQALGVRDLEEETSVNWSGGLAYSPISTLTFTADYFHILIDDRIILSGTLGGARIEDLVSEFGAQQVQVFSNAIDTRTRGIDLTANYRVLLGDEGMIRVRGAFNWTQNELTSGVDTPEQLSEEFQESIFGREARLELEEERPNTTTKLSASYERGPLNVTVRGTRYGETLVPDDTPEEDYTLSPEFVVGFEVGYGFLQDRVALTVGARNLFDNYPDLTPDGENFNGIFPYPTASPFGFNGRFVYTKLALTL